jgi:hypothetical protein
MDGIALRLPIILRQAGRVLCLCGAISLAPMAEAAPSADQPSTEVDAEQRLDDALRQARREDKRLFVVVTGEHCGPCIFMSRFLERQQPILKQDFIVVKFWRDHDASSDAVIQKIRAGKPGGIPWVAILDADGKILATGNDAAGKNLGFPNKPEGIANFVEMISSTSRHITSKQLADLEWSLVRGEIVHEVLDERAAQRRSQAVDRK